MMPKLPRRLFAHRGIVLLGLLVLAFYASPSSAHEIHRHDHDAHHSVQSDDEVSPRALLQRFRETGDDKYLDQAWSIIAESIEQSEDSNAQNPDFLIDSAMVAQARHRFDAALEIAGRAVELRPDDDQGWLLIAAIQLVRGEPAAARQACTRLSRSSWLVIVGCHARASHALGESASVQARVEQLIEVTDRSTVSEADLAWILSIAGDLAVANDDAERAVLRFQQSLDLTETTQVRAALVDELIRSNRLAEARDALNDGSDALPLAVRRMIVAMRMGAGDSIGDEVALADRTFRGWMADNDWLHAREMARFYLDVLPRPELARHIALINFDMQREVEDIRLVQRTESVAALSGQSRSGG